jgi:hypothetical protein
MKDATQPQLDFLATELPRFEVCKAWERAHNTRYVSRMFLVPKPGVNKWRLIIDLRELDSYSTCFNATRPSTEYHPLATRQTAINVGRKSAVSLPRYRASIFFSGNSTPFSIHDKDGADESG